MKIGFAVVILAFVAGCGSHVETFDSDELASAFQIDAKRIRVPTELQHRTSATFVLAQVNPKSSKHILCRHDLHSAKEVLFGVQYGPYGTNALQYFVHTSWHSKTGGGGANKQVGVVRFTPRLGAWSVPNESGFLEDIQAYEILRVDRSTNNTWTTGLVYWFE